MRGAIEITVRGLREAELLPRQLERARKKLLEDTAGELQNAVRGQIRSRSGRLAKSWQATVVDDNKAVLRSRGHPGAKASVRGAFLTPKRRRVLRFVTRGGATVYARWVRINPGAWVGAPFDRKANYVDKGLQKFPKLVADVFGRHFRNVHRGIG